jgi:acyl CoA:acetate/3-ketoacid CoA transferase
MKTRLARQGMRLLEVPPGSDLQRQVVDLMEFRPAHHQPRLMPAECFTQDLG